MYYNVSRTNVRECDIFRKEDGILLSYIKSINDSYNREPMEYEGLLENRGIVIKADEALAFALERCGVCERTEGQADGAFAEMLIEWFYSGNWYKNMNERTE